MSNTYVGHVIEFMRSPEAESTAWYLDSDTLEVVTLCECYDAEARHSDLMQQFRFTHAPGFPFGPSLPLPKEVK